MRCALIDRIESRRAGQQHRQAGVIRGLADRDPPIGPSNPEGTREGIKAALGWISNPSYLRRGTARDLNYDHCPKSPDRRASETNVNQP